MDFGLAGIESFVGLDSEQQQEAAAAAAAVEAEEKKSKNNGSRSVKQQERSGPVEENCRPFKMARADDFGISSKAMQIHHGTPLLRSNFSVHDTAGGGVCGGGGGGRSQPQMLSFGSPVSDVSFLSKEVGRAVGVAELGDNRNAQNLNLPYYQPTDNSAYTRNAGGGYGGGSMSGSMHGSFTGIRGPFTPAQWIELEHQALIYKYLTAGVPVPANLLIPIRKAINPAGFSGFNAGSFPSHSYGWGYFHLGFSGSSDPEPGRCRRTDGKKWRCSKDAVPDQKYCEKHINRGRHRSRKPVEVQISQAAAVAVPSGVPNNSAAAINNYNVKVAPVPTSSIVAVSPSLSSGAGGHATIPVQHQPAGPGGINILTPAEQIVGRFQYSRGLSDMLPSINLKSKDSPFSIPKQHIPFGESSNFGFVSTDSLLNPSQKSFSSPYANNAKNFTNSFLDFTGDQQTQDQHFLRHFMDDWPKDQSNRSAMIWPEELKSDWTQLSMSIPVSDFSSSSSSPYNPDRIVPSPVKLTREVLDPTQMGLGFGGVNNELNAKPGDWIPAAVPWGGNSMGGPLGEVLNNVSNSTRVGASCKSGSTSALNLMGGGGGGSSGGRGWDGSPQLGSSPTGVLQTAAFVSLSNSSSGSSPRGETKRTQEGAGVCDDLLGSAHASSSCIPA